MSSRSQSKARGLLVISIPAILAFILLRQVLVDPAPSASAPESARLANALSAANAPTPAISALAASGSAGLPTTGALAVLPLTPTSTATPRPTPTATPVPNNYIWVPWRSQFDGTPYASGNCGPASLGMVMSYFGEWWSSHGIRNTTLELTGRVAYDEGTDWPSLKYAAEKRNFKVTGLFDSAGGYRKWTVDDLVKEIEKERPVLLLVRQRLLPGHTNSGNPFDHYVIFLGLMADGRVVYHDSAWNEEKEGAYRIMSQETLLKAWRDTSVGLQYTAMSLIWEGEARKWDDPEAVQATAQVRR